MFVIFCAFSVLADDPEAALCAILSMSVPPCVLPPTSVRDLLMACSGLLPDSLSSLLQLNVLCLDGNSFSGRLPPGVASLPKLAVLALQGNKLSGK